MTRREKILAGVVGTFVAMAALGLGAHTLVIKPIRQVDKKTATLRDQLAKVHADRRAFFIAEEGVKKTTQHSFDIDIDKASAKSAELLTQQILRAGLPEMEFTRLPFGPRKLRGAQEIGWNIQGDGRLDQTVNLLFLLDADPHLHRVDGLTIAAGDLPGMVRVRFRYATLVIDPAPEVEPTSLQAKVSLDSAERRIFDGIVQRDILRPYIKRPPTPGSAPGSAPAATPGAPPGPESLRIVSLSEWLGEPEVHVRDLANQRTLRFKPGDELAGGTIAMVDYRTMPKAGSDLLQAFSRVIVRVGTEYWAIEVGKTLAQKYRLNPDQLPDSLARLEAAKTGGQ
ncbi:MAG: hypothetical protein L0Y58_06130 [Verrucomicrobia subdivision 3 bacterium]|nr:hypothetical protein [Limisphaerales bacterium]